MPRSAPVVLAICLVLGALVPLPAAQLTTSGSALVVVIPGEKRFHQPGCPLVRKAGSKVQVMKQARGRAAWPRAARMQRSGRRAARRGRRREHEHRLRAGGGQAISPVGLQAPEDWRHRAHGRESRAGPLALPGVQAADSPAREVTLPAPERPGGRIEPSRPRPKPSGRSPAMHPRGPYTILPCDIHGY
jgi:hypothetical protein